jgi:hypothetical protein
LLGVKGRIISIVPAQKLNLDERRIWKGALGNGSTDEGVKEEIDI